MKYLVYYCCVLAIFSCTTGKKVSKNISERNWAGYHVGTIEFEDKAPASMGSTIYHQIIPDAKSYIKTQAQTALATLYYSPQDDSIVPVRKIRYTLENIKGISAKGGGNGNISIFYSTRHIEKSFENNDTTKLLFETRGVLLHELTHAYQLEPQGIGSYGTNKTFWAFIEGMADAVRVANSGFGPDARPKKGNYMDGYRTTGYFLVWVRDHKDPDFLRKMNRSTLEINPWSFDGAIKHILGKKYNINELWHEYQVAVGDV